MRVKLWPAFALLLCLPTISVAADKLIFALDLIRHGDRTPIKALSTVDYKWKEGLGQLTATGMHQEYEMGKQFRQRYVITEHLLPEHYERDTMYVRATDYERTLMSAQSLLMGLYPAGSGPYIDDTGKPALPNVMQPIPIRSAPGDHDAVIVHQIPPAEEEQLLQKYVYSTPEWKQKETENNKHFKRWGDATGRKIERLTDVQLVGDALLIHKIHHVAMPAGLSDEDIDTIIGLNNWTFMAEKRPKAVSAAFSQQLVNNIADFIEKGSKANARLKYVLLSAHDGTIASTLSILGAPLDITPPYASDLNFSLYETDTRNYVVTVRYNGEPVSLPACGGTVCTLQQFIHAVRAG